MRIIKITITVLTMLVLFADASLSVQWTTDVQVSSRSGVFDVELAKDPSTDYLFAVLAWEGDGSSAHLSTDGGETWTETYHAGPGAVISDLAVTHNGNYFYVALSLPTVCVLFRFNATTGAQVPWGGADWILIAVEPFAEIELTSPDVSGYTSPPSPVDLHFVARGLSSDLYYSRSTGDMSAWLGGWQGVNNVYRGLSATSVYNPYGYEPTNDVYISYVQRTTEMIFNNTVAKISCLEGCVENLTYYGGPANETDIGAYGIPGEGGVLYYVFDTDPVGQSMMILQSDPNDIEAAWTGNIISTSGANLHTPALKVNREGHVGLAYTRSTTGGPYTLVQGKYEFHLYDQIMSQTDGPNETYPSSSLPRLGIPPSIVHTCGPGHGILYVRHNTPYNAYYTRRTTYCGEYTSGYSGNVNCSIDGKRNLADITRMIDRVYISKDPLCVESEGNTDGDDQAKVNLADITVLIDHVYISKAETAACQ